MHPGSGRICSAGQRNEALGVVSAYIRLGFTIISQFNKTPQHRLKAKPGLKLSLCITSTEDKIDFLTCQSLEKLKVFGLNIPILTCRQQDS